MCYVQIQMFQQSERSHETFRDQVRVVDRLRRQGRAWQSTGRVEDEDPRAEFRS